MQGTVFWMAPEVVNPGKCGYKAKVDIWGVGCVVLEMWTGERPWRKEEAMAVIVKVRTAFLPMNLDTGDHILFVAVLFKASSSNSIRHNTRRCCR